MTPSARLSAAIDILEDWLGGTALEQAFLCWSRKSRFAGSKDRAAVRDHIFTAARRRLSDAAIGGATKEEAITGRQLIIGQILRTGGDLDQLFTGEGYAPSPLTTDERAACLSLDDLSDDAAWPAPNWQYDIPQQMWPIWCAQVEAADEQATYNQDRAPVTLRVNTQRLSRDDVMELLLSQGLSLRAHPTVKTAILVDKGNPAQCPAYLDGSVEIQDAHSQKLITDVPALPISGDVLDFCAGGGGKALTAYAHWQRPVQCHDINAKRMSDIPARAGRAEARIEVLKRLPAAAKYACVLVDAPCSGSGSWRRAPDGKWSMTPQRLEELVALQRDILAQAAPYVAPGGWLYYMTCSVIADENQAQAKWFGQTFSDFDLVQSSKLAMDTTSDGLYGVLFRRNV